MSAKAFYSFVSENNNDRTSLPFRNTGSKHKVNAIDKIGRIYPFLGSVPSLRSGARIWIALK